MMKVLVAREVPGRGFLVRVHLDETRRLGDGIPDPEAVREVVFPSEAPEGQTKAQYLAAIRREVKVLGQHELARLQKSAETVLSFEGLAP